MEQAQPKVHKGLGMSCPTRVCMLLSSLDGPKALLVPQDFVPPTRYTAPRGKGLKHTKGGHPL